MQQYVSPDEIKKGCDARRNNKAACNLSRAGTARVHTRRLARASRVMGWIDLLFGEKVDGIAAETNKLQQEIALRLRTL